MASLRLGRYEVEEYSLPRVCARCGATAVVSPAKRFSWHPPWVVVFILVAIPIYIIIALALTKRMTVPVPFCERHRHYWRNRLLFVLGGLAVLLVLGVGGGILASALDDRGQGNIFGAVCGGTIVLGLIWLIAAAIVQAISIRPNEITDRSITLVGVSADFVDAVREERRADRDREDEEDDRPRRRRERDEGEDDRPRARRRPAEDDEGYYDRDKKERRRPPSDAYEEGDDRR
jgi:hypothetical protein